MVHGAGVEGGDLIVVQVGGDERLRRQGAGHFAHVRAIQPEALQAIGVRVVIIADGRHDERLSAQQLQAVGDVARASSEFAPQLRHQEGDVQDMDLVGKDVVLEAAVEHHDVVVGHRAADEGTHGSSHEG